MLRISNSLLHSLTVSFPASTGKETEKNDSKEEDSAADKSSSKEKDEKSAKKKKLVTIDRDLLMACSYFDLGHCGYFETKDLEDMLFTMNLNLSRAQIKKLVSKVHLEKLWSLKTNFQFDKY